jgi:hypothetical protein
MFLQKAANGEDSLTRKGAKKTKIGAKDKKQ